MFTKEKLESWIYWLDDCIGNTNLVLKQIKKTSPVYYKQEEKRDNLLDLKHTLEKLYTTMTKEEI